MPPGGARCGAKLCCHGPACIHTFGARGDLLDEGGYFRAAYATAPGDWVPVRPDGHVGAIVGSGDGNIEALERYLHTVGLVAESRIDA